MPPKDTPQDLYVRFLEVEIHLAPDLQPSSACTNFYIEVCVRTSRLWSSFCGVADSLVCVPWFWQIASHGVDRAQALFFSAGGNYLTASRNHSALPSEKTTLGCVHKALSRMMMVSLRSDLTSTRTEGLQPSHYLLRTPPVAAPYILITNVDY